MSTRILPAVLSLAFRSDSVALFWSKTKQVRVAHVRLAVQFINLLMLFIYINCNIPLLSVL